MVRLKSVRQNTMTGEKHFFECTCGFRGTFIHCVKHLTDLHQLPKGVAEASLFHTYFERNGKKDYR
jgi:hypothetical protein